MYSSKEQENITLLKRILHCFALNTELQRILNDEPTEEEKKQHEILTAYRDEQKAVDDEHFAITFIPDSSEASRVRATLIQEQRKDPFLSMIIDKLLTAEAVGKQLAQKQSDARSPSTSNQVSVNSKEDTEMIDLTMDDEEMAMHILHLTASTPNCRATPHHLNVAWI